MPLFNRVTYWRRPKRRRSHTYHIVFVVSSDSSSIGEGTPSVQLVLASPETVSIVETVGTSFIGVVGDTSAISEGTPSISQPSTDTGSGGEGVGNSAQSSADSATDVESTSIAATFNNSDIGVGSEGTSNIAQTETEIRTATDTTVSVFIADEAKTSTDTFTATDSAPVPPASLSPQDSGVVSETSAIVVTLSSTDSGVAVDTTIAVSVAFNSSDSGSITETSSIAINIASSDSGSATESSPNVTLNSSDIATDSAEQAATEDFTFGMVDIVVGFNNIRDEIVLSRAEEEVEYTVGMRES